MDYMPTMEVTVTCHLMPEEVKNPKVEDCQRKSEIRKNEKSKRVELRELRDNFKTMDTCMIYPSNIKIGSLKECLKSEHMISLSFNGTEIEYIEEVCKSIPGEKVLLEIKSDLGLYIDLDKVTTDKDLRDIRKRINIKDITIGEKILSCSFGAIRVDRNKLHQHPYFENLAVNEPISIKQLKKLLGNSPN